MNCSLKYLYYRLFDLALDMKLNSYLIVTVVYDLVLIIVSLTYHIPMVIEHVMFYLFQSMGIYSCYPLMSHFLLINPACYY